jgi:hypothetical protein
MVGPSSRHRNMMPYMELAPPSAAPSHRYQQQQQQSTRSLRHFGAGTARGVFRPHQRRPEHMAVSALVEGEGGRGEGEEEEDAMLRRVARESGLGDSSSSSSSDSDSDSSSSSDSSRSGEEGEAGGGGGGSGGEPVSGDGMEVVAVADPEESLPAHVPRPLWRFPEDWSRGDAPPLRHGLRLQRCVRVSSESETAMVFFLLGLDAGL